MTPRERPILFSGAMVRAILEGRKTQTRRVVRVQPPATNGDGVNRVLAGIFADCPYGERGDRLWVRESWASVIRRHIPNLSARPIYATDPVQGECEVLHRATDDDGLTSQGFRWRPSIHMPRWACRILLELVTVRYERLQDITTADIFAEGVRILTSSDGWPLLRMSSPVPFSAVSAKHPRAWGEDEYARFEWAHLWDSINGKKPGRAWADNPWVWTLTFKRVIP